MATENSTTKVCRVCGQEKPKTAFSTWHRECRDCASTRIKKDRQEHPEKYATYNRRWRQRHPEKVRARKRCNYPLERPRILRYLRAYYQKNQAKAVQVSRAYRAAHPEEVRAANKRWRQENPERARLLSAKKRARKRSLPATFSAAEQKFCRQYFHYACAACGNEEGFQWTIAMDHWIPLSSSDCPGTVATNMIPLCDGTGGCNTSKNNRDPHQWLLQRFGKRKAAQILQRIEAYFAVVRACPPTD